MLFREGKKLNQKAQENYRFLCFCRNTTFAPYNKDMLLKEAQSKVDDWINKVGVRYFSELTNTALLMEEVGELARIMARKYGEQTAKPTDNAENMADEMADVLFVLICLANQTGVDLTTAFENNLEKKNLRDAERHKNNPKIANPTNPD